MKYAGPCSRGPWDGRHWACQSPSFEVFERKTFGAVCHRYVWLHGSWQYAGRQ